MLKSKIVAFILGLAIIATPLAQAGRSEDIKNYTIAGSIALGTAVLFGTGFVVWKLLNGSMEEKLDAIRKEVRDEFQKTNMQLTQLNEEFTALKKIAEELGIQLEEVRHTTTANEALQVEIAKAVKVSPEKISEIIKSKQDAITALQKQIEAKKAADLAKQHIQEKQAEEQQEETGHPQLSKIKQMAVKGLSAILRWIQ